MIEFVQETQPSVIGQRKVDISSYSRVCGGVMSFVHYHQFEVLDKVPFEEASQSFWPRQCLLHRYDAFSQLPMRNRQAHTLSLDADSVFSCSIPILIAAFIPMINFVCLIA